MEVKNNILFAMAMSFLLSLLPELLHAQLYYQAPGKAIWQVSKKNPVPTSTKSDLAGTILKKYNKQLKKQQIVVPDSVYVVFEVDEYGEVKQIKERGGYIRTYINILEDNITKAKFAEAGEHRLALVFEPLKTESYSIWEVDEVPLLTSCKKVSKNGNEVFARSCFNYAVEERIRDLEDPAPRKKNKLRSRVKARITISPRGLVSMINFDAISTNPDANDFFMYQLYLVSFPKGLTQHGKTVSYHIDYNGGYFLNELEKYNDVDTSITFELSFHDYNKKAKQTSETSRYNIIDAASGDTVVFVPVYTELTNYQIGHKNFTFWSDEKKAIIAPEISCPLTSRAIGPLSLCLIATPTYPDSLQIKLPFYTSCAHGSEKENSICSSQQVINQIQEYDSFPKWVDLIEQNGSRVIVLFDEQGNIFRQQVVQGDFYTQLDLECLSILSQLTKFEPATLNGIEIPFKMIFHITTF